MAYRPESMLFSRKHRIATIMRSPATTKRLLLLLWAAFIIRGLWYSAAMPIWEGYDEPYHFAYLQHLAAGGLSPGTAVVSLEVQHSLHLLPLAWELYLQHPPPPLITYDSFWQLPATDRELLISGIRRLSPGEGNEPATEGIPNYEFQQMPLYYWFFSIPMGLMGRTSLLSRVIALRILSVLLASIAVPLAFKVARQVLGEEGKALGVTALLVLLPELMVNLARVGNESLALVLMTLALVYALKTVEQPERWSAWIALGLALGLGLLTKAYFLVTLPALVLIALYLIWTSLSSHGWKRQTIRVTLRACAAVGIILAVAGRWYWHVHVRTGSWSGQADDAALHNIALAQKLIAIPSVNWKSGAISILLSHIWFGGWSFLRLPVGWYLLAAVPIAVGVSGVGVRWMRERAGAGPDSQRPQILVLGALYLCFWVGLAYHVLITFMNTGVSASTGWYLYCLVVAELVLLVWGLEAFFQTKFLLLALCLEVAVMDLYGMHALMLPYYVGLSAHMGKQVPTALASTLSHLPTVFARLAINKPDWLSTPVLVILWFLYLGATVGGLLICAISKELGRLEDRIG